MEIKQFSEEYYFLSNFYECPVTYKEITYQNNEAAFQAQKCINEKDRTLFANLNASQAKKLGREIPLRKDWESIKVKEMAAIVYAKFTQNENLQEKLLSTGDAYLEEGNTWGDRIWGVCNGSGQNLLGQILMSTREKIREQNREL
jgi:hypothetical protein